MNNAEASSGLGQREPTLWTQRWAQATTRFGLGGVALALVGSVGTGLGLWNFQIGFLFLAVGMGMAVLALLFALVALIKGRGTMLRKKGIGLGVLGAIALLGVMGWNVSRGAGAPMIHDVTTNLANPPAFTKLSLRKDNLVGVGTIEKWRELHAESYSDIGPIMFQLPPAEVMKRARALVQARGWEIALATEDRIEATDTTAFFRFKDDVVIVVSSPSEGFTQLDMRSVSRVGISDVGVNARRIRAFLKDMQAKPAAGS